jgi:outer membrane biosynthesis protein TonB
MCGHPGEIRFRGGAPDTAALARMAKVIEPRGPDAAGSFAATNAVPGEFDADAIRLAEAMAWMKANRPDEALKSFERLKGFDESEERARQRLLKGNAHLAQAEQHVAGEQWDEGIQQATKAAEAFASSLKENAESMEAKRNLEIARDRERTYRLLRPPPTPTPPPQPTPQAQPSPTPSPQPSPQGPTPTPDPSASPTPQPNGQPSPTPQAEGTPQPQDGDSEQKPEPGEEGNAGEADAKDLTEEETERILDALLEQEKRMRDQILRRNLRQIPVEKDY